jgi:tetratricopeptide (TPR) repeat protein
VALALGRPIQARQYYVQAQQLPEVLDDDRNKAHALVILGNFERKTKHIARAGDYYAEALPLFRKVDDNLGTADTQIRQGEHELLRGRYEVARQYFLDARESLVLQEDTLNDAASLIGLSAAELALGQLKKASDHLLAARHACRAIRGSDVHVPMLVSFGALDRGDSLQAVSRRRCAEAANLATRTQSRGRAAIALK